MCALRSGRGTSDAPPLNRADPTPHCTLWGAMKTVRTLLYRRPRSLRWSIRGFVLPRWPGARSSNGRATRGRPVRTRFALEQDGGAVSHFTADLMPGRRARRGRRTSGCSSGWSSSRCGRTAATASTSTLRPSWSSGCARTSATRRPGASTPRSSASASTVTRSRSWPTHDAARRALEQRRSRRAPRGLPHRLRPGRQRPQGGRAHRRPRRLERGDGVGSRTTSRIREYHWSGIMDSLRRAAAHLPRVDAIGGSAAGVYVDNQVKFSSLFRGVAARAVRAAACANMFRDLQRAWSGVPFDVVNDGDVTALLGSMSLRGGGVLGIALGTSTAGGYVTAERAHHALAQRDRLRPHRLPPRCARATSGRATRLLRAVPVAAGGGPLAAGGAHRRRARDCRCPRSSR